MKEYLCLTCKNCGEKFLVQHDTIFGKTEYIQGIYCRYFKRKESSIYTICPVYEKKEMEVHQK